MNVIKLLAFVILFLTTTLNAKEYVKYKSAVEGNNQFSINLYQTLATSGDKRDKNIFFSPFSISEAFAMTITGARGETAKEIQKTLHFPSNDAKLHSSFTTLNKELQSRTQEGLRLNLANAIWLQEGMEFNEKTKQLIKEYYQSAFHVANFIHKDTRECARQEINSWVSKKTENKIRELIEKNILDATTRMVLVNAIYFKGKWAYPFKKFATSHENFYTNNGKSITVPMMHQKQRFNYYENRNLQVLELPYGGKSLSMVIFLPRKGVPIDALDKALSTKHVDGVFKQMSPTRVALSLPRFKFETKYYLKAMLKRMGMVTPFSNSADFSGFTTKEGLKIAKVIHGASITVDEEGSEAAAATAIIMKTKGIHKAPHYIEFRADHPFIFMIRDRKSGVVLFMGRVMKP